MAPVYKRVLGAEDCLFCVCVISIKKCMVFQQNAFAPQAQQIVAPVAGAVPPTRPVSVKSKYTFAWVLSN